MWRWCLRTVSNVGGFARNSLHPQCFIPPSRVVAHFSVQTTPSFADRLRELLSPTPSETLPTVNCTSTHVRGLYYGAKARGQLASFTSAHFSDLISLFGSLSMSTPQRPYRSFFSNQMIECMSPASFQPFWPFIQRLGNDKRAVGLQLNDSDRYWLMRAHIATLYIADSSLSVSDRKKHMRLAKLNYTSLCHLSHSEIHVPYLRVLLSSGATAHFGQCIQVLCQLLRTHPYPQPHLLPLLWKVVLHSTLDISAADKEKILLSVSRCLRRHRSVLHHPDCSDDTLNRGSQHKRSTAIRTNDVVSLFQDAIFNLQKPSPWPSSEWVLSIARELLMHPNKSEEPLADRWSHLVILAIAINSPRRAAGNFSAAVTGRSSSSAGTHWQTICILTYLENRLLVRQETLPNAVVQRTGRMLEIIWANWNAATDEAVPIPIVRAVCTSFLRLAEHLRTRRLGNACDMYCSSRGLWSVVEGEDRDSGTSSVLSLGQAYLTWSLSCGTNAETALAHTTNRLQVSAGLSEIVGEVISKLSSADSQTAYELSLVARRIEIDLPTTVTTTLAISLANVGSIHHALEHLHRGGLTPEQHLEILRQIIHVLVRQTHRFRTEYFTPAIGDALLQQFSFLPPPATLRSDLQATLLLMPRFQQSATAVAIVQAVRQADVLYFAPSFLAGSGASPRADPVFLEAVAARHAAVGIQNGFTDHQALFAGHARAGVSARVPHPPVADVASPRAQAPSVP
ncbi:uncharacterized protein FIBRA_06427 [Fibroporia radiculosa]|uniref:Uncharacterized protein n=1 Tax=Fibroporia radiculosa TaxID=599839 RepID=J4GSQ5_9APHY|nr:uncharacterized protein FIBRA_06427 [Fibroporia radiculosa]CCM04260.1 predicted protein [Fibroporia radiculosa]